MNPPPIGQAHTGSAPVGVVDPWVIAALRVYVKLLRASKAVLTRVEPRLAKQGLTATQLGVLEVILHQGPLSQRALGRKVLTSAGNMTDVIDKLEARGLVCRSRMPNDRRSVRVELTPSGHCLIGELFPLHAEDIAGAMTSLDPREMALLDGLLRKLGRGAAADPTGHDQGEAPLATDAQSHQFTA
jgi:MarR family 2-MHQ and catechol resistance regulon transcriptional repressor